MYCIYFIDPETNDSYHEFEEELIKALKLTEFLRKQGMRFVSMVSENKDVIGKPGADSVANGLLPDGNEYMWKKRRDRIRRVKIIEEE